MKGPYHGDPHEALLLAEELPPPADGEPLRFIDVALAVRDDRPIEPEALASKLRRWLQATRCE